MRQQAIQSRREIARPLGVHRNETRPRVGPQVVYARQRQVTGNRDRLGRGDAQREATGQAGAGGYGDGLDARPIRMRRGLAQEQRQIREMLPRGEFRHDAAVSTMQVDLAGDPFADQSAGRIEEGHGALVTRTFDGEDHGNRPMHRRAGCGRRHDSGTSRR